MTKTFFITLILSLSIYIVNAQTRVACIGNSITFGSGVENREVNCYPVQLQNMLGSKYEVKNFGKSARTMLRKGNAPYWNEPLYKEALDYLPNIVIVKLGTNDSKPYNWKYKSEFEKDYKDFIHSFAQLSSHPKIFLCKPVPVFSSGGDFADSVITKQVIPLIEKIAKDEKLDIIDLYTPFIGKGNLVPDGIHPNAKGAKLLAGVVFNNITKKTPEDKYSGVKSNWYGFDRYDFYFNGRQARLVCPKNIRHGNPWIWNARFPDWHPEMDSILLSEGFFVTNLNTDELLGSPECVEIWKEYYSYLVKNYGLNKNVALEGVSRGGLYVYNFAAQYPELISCIYGEGPVCDFKSWPGGFGYGRGSKEDWELLKRVYNFKNDSAALAYKHNPIDNLENIAKAKIPIIHFINKTDSVVPSDENTLILAEMYKKLGGEISLVFCSKLDPGTHGHHYKIETPRKAADFIISNTIKKSSETFTIENPKLGITDTPVFGGWKERHEQKLKDIETGTYDLVFIGNSITHTLDNFGGKYDSLKYVWGKYIAPHNAINLGYSGFRTENILWNLKNGELNFSKSPKLFVLKIGTNNADGTHFPICNTAEQIFKGTKAIIDLIREKHPTSKILMIRLFPKGLIEQKSEGISEPVFSFSAYEVNQTLKAGEMTAQLADNKNVFWMDINYLFLRPDGKIDVTLMPDLLHPNYAGAEKWIRAIEPKIAELMNEPLIAKEMGSSKLNKIESKTYHKYIGNFNNSRIKFEKEKIGRVAFLGGSITYNGGWRDSICKYLKQRFPETKFEFIKAGIPSTGSVPGAFRFTNDVWSKGKIDLLFEEAAVNDGPDGNNMTSTLMIRGMEGIVRHARELNPAMDIVMMHFVDPGKIKMYNEGTTPEVIQQFDKVADHYGISTINLAKEVTDRINNNEFSWKKDFIDLHPSPFGQGIYGNSIIEFFNHVWSKELPTNSKIKNHKISGKKLDVFSYSKGEYIDIKDAKLNKGWKYVEKWKSTDVGGREGFENVPVLEATEAGAELQITFTGTAAGVFVAAGPDAGILETSVDGQPFTRTDLFTKWSAGLHLPWAFVLQDDLNEGKHTMTIRISKEHNQASKGNACRIVHFIVNR
jgi:lysophospholipase L1-like esterase